MDSLFAPITKELISEAREAAIDMGYDYISTLHIFIADCEDGRPDSLLHFGFNNKTEFDSFKAHHTLPRKDLLAHFDDSLPLTIEAEMCIRKADEERRMLCQKQILPCHLFLAAIKNKDSVFYECYAHDAQAPEKLLQFYQAANVLTDIEPNTNSALIQQAPSTKVSSTGLWGKIKGWFK